MDEGATMRVIEKGSEIRCSGCEKVVFRMTEKIITGQVISLEDVERVDGGVAEHGRELQCAGCGRTLTFGDFDRASRPARMGELPAP